MELRSLSVKRYKGYRGDTSVEIAPLTILVGANNSGKTALAQSFHLLARSLASPGDDIREPLLMSSGGVRYGRTFMDLVNGRFLHGRLSLSAVLVHEGSESSLSVTVQNVSRPFKPSERQILKWSFSRGDDRVEATRESLDQQSSYEVIVSGGETSGHQLNWLGLLPRKPHQLPDWVDAQAEEIRKWARGVRYLECPRSFSSSRFTMEEPVSSVHEAKGAAVPMILVADDDLRDSVRKWYKKAFEVSLDVRTEGRYFDLMVGSPAHGTDVLLDQSGGGLSQVLPVVVTALTAKQAGPGIDIIEHPEAELHPAAHAHVAELLLSNLSGSDRPMIIETHSEMILLRARRWIAEGRLPHDHVVVYWINTEPEHGSVLQKIAINDCGEMSSWPDGVFIEDYEEVLAIRRASVRNMGR